MLALQLISIELLLGVIAIGVLSAWGKSIGERICLLATIPVSFLLAFLMTKIGIWNFSGSIVKDIIENTVLTGGGYAGTAGLTGAMTSSVVAQLLFPLLFWVFLILTRLLVRLLLKKLKVQEKYKLFSEPTDKKVKIGVCALGALQGFLVLMLSLLPAVTLLSAVTPAIERGREAKYEGTYAAEIVAYVDDTYVAPLDNSILMKTCEYTGMRFILTATSDSIAQRDVAINETETVSVSGNELLRSVLSDGVTGLALYEYWCDPAEHTVGECAEIADVLRDVSEHEILMQVIVEMANGMTEETTEEGDLMGLIMQQVKGSHATDMAAACVAFGDIAAVVAEENDKATLEADELTAHLFATLKDEEASAAIAQAMASSELCCSVMDSLLEYGLDVVCTMIDISEDKDTYYDDFISHLYTVLNDSEIGKADLTLVEEFILYLIENDMAVSDFEPSTGEMSDEDVLYHNYDRFMAQRDMTRDVFEDFRILRADEQIVFFSPLDEVAYVYDAADDRWHVVASADEITARDALLLQFLVEKDNFIHYGDKENVMITAAMIAGWVSSDYDTFAGQYRSLLKADLYEQSGVLARILVEKESFSPDAVFARDIVSTIKNISFKEALADEGGVESFGELLAAVSKLMNSLSDGEEDMIEAVLRNFSEVGRLLDALNNFSATADVPENMLRALAQNRNYKSYLAETAIDVMIANADSGVSDYESVFATIEVLYIIASGIIK